MRCIFTESKYNLLIPKLRSLFNHFIFLFQTEQLTSWVEVNKFIISSRRVRESGGGGGGGGW